MIELSIISKDPFYGLWSVFFAKGKQSESEGSMPASPAVLFVDLGQNTVF